MLKSVIFENHFQCKYINAYKSIKYPQKCEVYIIQMYWPVCTQTDGFHQKSQELTPPLLFYCPPLRTRFKYRSTMLLKP